MCFQQEPVISTSLKMTAMGKNPSFRPSEASGATSNITHYLEIVRLRSRWRPWAWTRHFGQVKRVEKPLILFIIWRSFDLAQYEGLGQNSDVCYWRRSMRYMGYNSGFFAQAACCGLSTHAMLPQAKPSVSPNLACWLLSNMLFYSHLIGCESGVITTMRQLADKLCRVSLRFFIVSWTSRLYLSFLICPMRCS